jgi:hypothetical protein
VIRSASSWIGACSGLLVGIACGRSPSNERSAEPARSAPSSGAAGATHESGVVGAGALTESGVLLGIVDDPPRVWHQTNAGRRSWPAPARIGALASGARPGEVIVAAAWPEARRPGAEVWWFVDGVEQRHCVWQAPALERWRAQPRGASSVLALPDGAVVAGVDGSLVRFDASCAVTVLHGERCCEEEQPLRLRGDSRAWSAVDIQGHRVHASGSEVSASSCVPSIDRTTVRGDRWNAALPADLGEARALDWSAACDVVLVAAGTAAWTCRAAGCTRVR